MNSFLEIVAGEDAFYFESDIKFPCISICFCCEIKLNQKCEPLHGSSPRTNRQQALHTKRFISSYGIACICLCFKLSKKIPFLAIFMPNSLIHCPLRDIECLPIVFLMLGDDFQPVPHGSSHDYSYKDLSMLEWVFIVRNSAGSRRTKQKS